MSTVNVTIFVLHKKIQNGIYLKGAGILYSFHKECLKDINYCPICSNHLNNVILFLSVSANASFKKITKVRRMMRKLMMTVMNKWNLII